MSNGRIKVSSLRDEYEELHDARADEMKCKRCHASKGWLDFARLKGVIIYCGADAGFHGPFIAKEREC